MVFSLLIPSLVQQLPHLNLSAMHDARQSSIVRMVLQLVICLWFFIYRSVLALSSGVVDIPLIVRSPYLSAWQPVNGTSKSPIGWPTRPTPSEYVRTWSPLFSEDDVHSYSRKVY